MMGESHFSWRARELDFLRRNELEILGRHGD